MKAAAGVGIAAMLWACAAIADEGGDAEIIARIHYDSGREHYVAGHYVDALREFVEAYRLSNRAELLYNRARCFEELGFPDEAIACYRGYIARGFSPNAVEIEQRVAALERRRRHGTVDAACPTELPGPPSPPPPRPLVKRWWFWTTVAVGSAVLGGVIAGAVVGTRPPDAIAFPRVN